MFVSVVPPDLLATMKSVFSTEIELSIRRTEDGLVLSRTRSWGYPDLDPNVARHTSGQRLLPPIPKTTAWVNPDLQIPPENETSSCAFFSIRSTLCSQPRRLRIDFLWTSSDRQIVKSLCHNREIIDADWNSASVFSTALRRSPGKKFVFDIFVRFV
jgi:hypothetical protein